MSDNYITPKDMEQIAKVCVALDDVYNAIIDAADDLSFDTFFDGEPFRVYDSNRESVGTIGFTEAGCYGLYLDASED